RTVSAQPVTSPGMPSDPDALASTVLGSSWHQGAGSMQTSRKHPPDADKRYFGRRLVVIAAFDILGFSSIVEADEEDALAAWRALRQAIDPLIAAAGGRIFKSLGDGLLVEFSGPVDATRAALEVQAVVGKLPAVRGIQFSLRCAIHMGEVAVEGTDL